jgi:hypothetical protein
MPTFATDTFNWGPMRFRAVPAAKTGLSRASRLQPLGIVAGFRMGFAGRPRPTHEQPPEAPSSKDAK